MGSSQQRAKPKKRNAARKRDSRPKQGGGAASDKLRPAADARQPASPDQLLTLQRQIGNKSTGRLLASRDRQVIRREGALDQAREALFAKDKALEAKKNEVHEYDKATYDELQPRAQKLAQGLNKVMTADYDEMIKDVKGLKAIDTTAKVDRYLESAFHYSRKGEDGYIGTENLPLVMAEIEAQPGLFEKLGLLRAMEPEHARLIGVYLGIPPLQGFDYDITTATGGAGGDLLPSPELKFGSGLEAGATKSEIHLVCKQDGEELWSESYTMYAAGVSVSLPTPIPVNFSFSSGQFETQVFWKPSDFVGGVQTGAATFAAGFGYSVGTTTFYGSGNKGSLTIDSGGQVYTIVDIGISEFNGYLVMMGSGDYKMPNVETLGYSPKIKVTEDVDKSMPLTFEKNGEYPAATSNKDDFLKFLAHALDAQRLHVTINGFYTLDKKHNVDLMDKRILRTRELILSLAEARGIDTTKIKFSEIRTKRDEKPKDDEDPHRDRVTKVHLKGTILVRSPDEAGAGD